MEDDDATDVAATPMAEMLRIYRAIHRLKTNQLAAQIGVSAQTITTLERGAAPQARVLFKLLPWLFQERKARDADAE